ncbi:MAG: prephenate dehydratase [Verrucomicrobiota bacterium]
MHVAELRKKIDALDRRLVSLLNARARVAVRIGQLKQVSAVDVYVPAREKTVLAHVQRENHGPLGKEAMDSIYREIMSSTRSLERQVRVAHFGQATTFTHQAARLRFGASVTYIPCETISDVFEKVRNGQADHGVVPIENSTEGAVTYTLDEFAQTPLKICAEIYLPISHHLMARHAPRVAANPCRGIRQVVSHPQVLAQCRNWLHTEMPGVEIVPATSTARAAEMAVQDRRVAAIGSILAAEHYHLQVLAAEIQDLSGNMTRFLVIGKSFGSPTGDDKTSIFFAVKHKAGTLHNALGALKKYRLNMTKIESRPNKLKAWEYLFFVDIEGHVMEPRVHKALRELERHCTLMTVLGAYPQAPEAAED